MSERIYINNDWEFTEKFDESLVSGTFSGEMTSVRVPHTVKEIPYHYCNENDYQMVSGYRRKFEVPVGWKGYSVLLTFDAVGHDSKVYVNGKLAGKHHCGYTAFTLDISELLEYGKENTLVVACDSRESLNVPPFGFVIDYMTYGGIYRDVYIDIKDKTHIEDIFITTKQSGLITEPVRMSEQSQTISEIKITNAREGLILRQSIREKGNEEFTVIGEEKVDDEANVTTLSFLTGKIKLWDIDNPVLYEMVTELVDDGVVLDRTYTTFGYRKAIFRTNGFYLNGRKVKIRGLNRHQAYPYVGYAMPDSMQINDADILKNELSVNAVRTSHYPQSHSFIGRCDEIGLLVFTELPGWQHIGDEEWKAQAVQNVSDMITQYRNHPSIILWGVRINESVDDDDFYERTNAVAHALDPSRQTGGVRCYKKGSLLEDVFTYNDFIHDGKRKGCEKKADVTPDMDKPYLISEYNGHMFPTKTFDNEEHRLEHLMRHVNVLNEVGKHQDISGSFGWCMFDYNTHKDFGSGDRICYHGVMDMFRNPKLASYIYAVQKDERPVLEVTSSMDIGEHPGSNRGMVYIISNADEVRMYKNDEFIKSYYPADSSYKFIKNGPILVDDYIGDALEINEKMPHGQAQAVKALLNETARVGLYGLSKMMYLKAGRLIVQYGMKMSDAVELFNKYIGNWGGESTTYKFEAIKDGEVVKTVVKAPMTEYHLEIDTSSTELFEINTYDVAAIRVSAVDEYGNVLPFFNDTVEYEVSGDIELIGPSKVSLHGGFGGTYVKTKGVAGKGALTVKAPNGDSRTVEFSVRV